MAILDWAGAAAKVVRNIDRLMNSEAKHGRAIEKLTDDLTALKERIVRLEAREEVILERAQSAARTAASQAVMHNLSEISGRVGVLEGQRTPPASPRLTGRRTKKADPD